MDRRRFVSTLAGGVAAGLVAPPALARLESDPGWAEPELAALGDHRTRVHSATLARLPAAAGFEHCHAELCAAMAAVERVSRCSIEDQVHPGVQAFLADCFETIGRRTLDLCAFLEDCAEGAREPDPGQLAAMLSLAGEGFAAAEVSEASARLNRNGLAAHAQRIATHGLRAEARRALRRIARLEELAFRIAGDPGSTSVLSPGDDDVHRRVALGVARWHGGTAPVGASPSALQVLGIIACGLGMLVSGLYIVAGIACAIECWAGMIWIALFAALVFAGFTVGLVFLVRGVRERGTRVVERDGAWTLLVEADAGLRIVRGLILDPDRRYLATSSGTVRMLRGGPRVDADGDPRFEAGTSVLLAIAPLGALVGQCGNQRFLVGGASMLPEGLVGALFLAVNGPGGERPGAFGGFRVRVEEVPR